MQKEEAIKKINETLKSLSANDLKEKIFFDGEIYDAYSKIIDILQKAKEELIIIDGYADKSLLDIIRNINIPVTLITKNKYEEKSVNDILDLNHWFAIYRFFYSVKKIAQAIEYE